ncbi:DUF389 domain-containing protein [Conexibacter woesei]|uniref:Hydrophobic domain protein n=1 Tax=Conexibacter woesei (strain DSM 14684 / CCUG 47730 / CIP 108061 / JCM 11494 / NBRC 100937 / ID131577) TaxID=469383 RepID=D3FFJ7_CONWI|nr:DUF389 domain-containing protein [Conexibacter woesei]ADB53790.1 conserved hypothetical protein [Conexibacter woesei DSM 14684]
MIHLRIVSPPRTTATALELLERAPAVCNVVHLPGAARKPDGDVLLCDVAREDASVIVGELRALGIPRDGSIAMELVDTSISDAADRAERAAEGLPSDAVVWERVEAEVGESTELSASFLAFMVIATLIAGIGILLDSPVLIVGAMVVGPEFGPLAGVAVALVQRRPALARRSLAALVIGFAVAIVVTFVVTELGQAIGLVGPEHTKVTRPLTGFTSNPDEWSVFVALLAGVAGTLSFTTSKSSVLVGVLISVTTIPAAANVAVAAAAADWGECGGAAAQLAINLIALTVACAATLAVQRSAFVARRSRHRRARRDPSRNHTDA